MNGWDDLAAPYAALWGDHVRQYTERGVAARRKLRIGLLESICDRADRDPPETTSDELAPADALIAERRSAWLAHARRPRPFEVVMMIEHSATGVGPFSETLLLGKPGYWLAAYVTHKFGLSPEARMTRSLLAGRCPSCRYLVADPASQPDSARKRISTQRRCSECGHPWPLVPPPISALPG